MPWPVGGMVTLNQGWPFGEGPAEWGCRGEERDGQVHLVCDLCDQSVFPLAPDLSRGFRVTLDMLRSRVADHCLKCHADVLGDAIRT
jgi:hypothetical protein